MYYSACVNYFSDAVFGVELRSREKATEGCAANWELNGCSTLRL
jgi:hypothetical protein